MAKIFKKTLNPFHFARQIGEALIERCSHELINVLFPAPVAEEQSWPHPVSPSMPLPSDMPSTPAPVVEEEIDSPLPEKPVVEKAPEPIDQEVKKPAQPIFIRSEEPEYFDTEMVLKKDTIEKSRFVCGECGQNHRGDYMKAEIINPRGYIPGEQEIIASSLCKFCAPAKDSNWLAAVIRFAKSARKHRVEFVMQMMENSLYGDKSKPDHVRFRHMRKPKSDRAEQALSFYYNLIVSDSSLEVFNENEEALKLIKIAQGWNKKPQPAEEPIVESPASKRASKILARIEAGNYPRALNTIKAARREFPDSNDTWNMLEQQLENTRNKAERQEQILTHRQVIKKAVEDDDIESLVDHIAFGAKNYPEINWEDFANEAMA